MTSIHAKSALTPTGWQRNVRVMAAAGRVTSVEPGSSPVSEDDRVDLLLPGMPNLHTHAFQRGMAGLAEIGGPAHDNFWSWRSAMYRFALAMSPDDVQAVAAMLYVEMLEAGFTRVGEFHYLHHDPGGRAYTDAAEMARRIVAAAGETGIGLTLLPCFYAHAGFGGAPPIDGQRRFVCSLDQFATIVEGCRDAVKELAGAVVGVAPHSLRAVTPQELAAVVGMAGGGPIHVHAAEQIKEVDDCIAWSGTRPVRWLLDHAAVDHRWCVIHATHLVGRRGDEAREAETERGDGGENDRRGIVFSSPHPHAPSPAHSSLPVAATDEIGRLAGSGATAGLCPITEANLGDGTFPAAEFIGAGGRWGIGSDSNVLIGVGDELRQLEYAQRLRRGLRNVVSSPGRSTGRLLFDQAVAGGGIALDAPAGLAVGNRADFVSLSTELVPYLADDAVLDSWIFARSVKVDRVWTGGRCEVEAGRHWNRAAVESRFRETMRGLTTRR